MQELTPIDKERLQGPVNKSYFILDIHLDELIHVATGQDGQWGEIEYTKGFVRDLRVGQQAASMALFNVGNRYTTPALLGQYHRKPIKVWSAPANRVDVPLLLDYGYVEDGYFEEPEAITPLLVFSGHITEIRAADDYLHIVATRSASQSFPRIRIVPPLANWTAPRDTVINFNGTVIRLTPRL